MQHLGGIRTGAGSVPETGTTAAQIATVAAT